MNKIMKQCSYCQLKSGEDNPRVDVPEEWVVSRIKPHIKRGQWKTLEEATAAFNEVKQIKLEFEIKKHTYVSITSEADSSSTSELRKEWKGLDSNLQKSLVYFEYQVKLKYMMIDLINIKERTGIYRTFVDNIHFKGDKKELEKLHDELQVTI